MGTNTLERLLHIEEIKNLRIKYAHSLDSKNIATAALLFTENAFCQTDRTPWNGRQEIIQGLEKAFQDYDKKGHGSYPFLHAITNQLIEITGPDTAKGRSYLIDLVTDKDRTEGPLLLLGIYNDEYSLVDGEWLISWSRLELVWPERNI